MDIHLKIYTLFGGFLALLVAPLIWSCGSGSVQSTASNEPFTFEIMAKETTRLITWDDPGDHHGNTWTVFVYTSKTGHDSISGYLGGTWFNGNNGKTVEADPSEYCGVGKQRVTTASSGAKECTVTECPDNKSKDKIKCVSKAGRTLLDSLLDQNKMAGQHMEEGEPAIDGVEVLLDSLLMGKTVEIFEE